MQASTMTVEVGGTHCLAATGLGCTPLHWAAQAAQPAAVAALLAAGAGIEARDELGRTPLHHAAAGDALELIEANLPGSDVVSTGYDARVSAQFAKDPLYAALEWPDGGATAVGAADSRQAACVRALLAAGADRGARERSGLTPAKLAAKHNHVDCFKLLAGL